MKYELLITIKFFLNFSASIFIKYRYEPAHRTRDQS